MRKDSIKPKDIPRQVFQTYILLFSIVLLLILTILFSRTPPILHAILKDFSISINKDNVESIISLCTGSLITVLTIVVAFIVIVFQLPKKSLLEIQVKENIQNYLFPQIVIPFSISILIGFYALLTASSNISYIDKKFTLLVIIITILCLLSVFLLIKKFISFLEPLNELEKLVKEGSLLPHLVNRGLLFDKKFIQSGDKDNIAILASSIRAAVRENDDYTVKQIIGQILHINNFETKDDDKTNLTPGYPHAYNHVIFNCFDEALNNRNYIILSYIILSIEEYALTLSIIHADAETYLELLDTITSVIIGLSQKQIYTFEVRTLETLNEVLSRFFFTIDPSALITYDDKDTYNIFEKVSTIYSLILNKAIATNDYDIFSQAMERVMFLISFIPMHSNNIKDEIRNKLLTGTKEMYFYFLELGLQKNVAINFFMGEGTLDSLIAADVELLGEIMKKYIDYIEEIVTQTIVNPAMLDRFIEITKRLNGLGDKKEKLRPTIQYIRDKIPDIVEKIKGKQHFYKDLVLDKLNELEELCKSYLE